MARIALALRLLAQHIDQNRVVWHQCAHAPTLLAPTDTKGQAMITDRTGVRLEWRSAR